MATAREFSKRESLSDSGAGQNKSMADDGHSGAGTLGFAKQHDLHRGHQIFPNRLYGKDLCLHEPLLD